MLKPNQKTAIRKNMKEYVLAEKEISELEKTIDTLRAETEENVAAWGIALHRREEAENGVNFIVKQVDKNPENEKELSKLMGPYLSEIAMSIVGINEED